MPLKLALNLCALALCFLADLAGHPLSMSTFVTNNEIETRVGEHERKQVRKFEDDDDPHSGSLELESSKI